MLRSKLVITEILTSAQVRKFGSAKDASFLSIGAKAFVDVPANLKR